MKALCAGHVNWDVTLRVDRLPAPDGEVRLEDEHRAGGGSAANVATVLAGLGHETRLFGSVGDDESGTAAAQALRRSGVDPHLVRVDRQTAVKYLIVDGTGEVMVLANDGANEAFVAADLPEETLAIDHLHLTSQPPEVAATLADRAHDRGATVSFDPGRRLGDRAFGPIIERVDTLFVNEREAVSLLNEGFDRLHEAATLVITRGSEGAEVRVQDRTVTHDGYAVDPLDTTGTGDAFAAGFLAARAEAVESDETEPREIDYKGVLAFANACGALAAGRLGARTDLGREAVEEFLARHGQP